MALKMPRSTALASPTKAQAWFTKMLNAYQLRGAGAAKPCSGISFDDYTFLMRHRLLQLADIDLEAVDDDTLRHQISKACRRNVKVMFEQQQALYQLRQHPDCPDFDVIKGMPLATKYYHHVSHRHCGDIDILCASPEVVLQLESVLANLAYTPRISHRQLGTQPRPAYFLSSTPSHWCSPSGRWEIEIHWQQPSRGKFPEFMQHASYWESITMPYGEERILRPAPLMLYLIMHGGRSAWRRLKWLVDLDRVSQTMRPEDWQEFAELVAASSWQRAVSLAADIAAYWMPSSDLAQALGKHKKLYPKRLYRSSIKHQYTKNALEFGFFPSWAHNYAISESDEYRQCMIRSAFVRAADVRYANGPNWLLWPLAIAARPVSFVRRQFNPRALDR